MQEKIIRFQTVDEIKEFVGAACKCPFDIDVVSGRITIDAKSILGMLSVNWKDELRVVYEARNERFNNVVKKYAVG
ncbi:MAG: HPr family phosphocarrier protein [Blautia sp.]|nr:HPr family phosphocarrier protein [Blautia sp.]MDD7370251.1 HPr family phosphocarrier protein [Bacillota bacterium]MDY3716388.1 HPr family phosphocarrier protein [Blautia sp.]